MKFTDSDATASQAKLDQFLTSFYATPRQELSGQPAPSAPIDPPQVAAVAQLHLEAERRKGNVISTTEAVAYILEQRRQH
jgi:hypothetical protein